MTLPRPPALLLAGNSNAVSAARSLASARIDVYAVGPRASAVRHSRFLTRFYADVPPQPGTQQPWLELLVRERLGAVLIPCCDDGIELIALHRETLADHGYLMPELSDQRVPAMLDKEQTYALADAIGVRVPRTVAVDTRAGAEAALAVTGLPCMLKPRHSHAAQVQEGVTGKPVVVTTVEELDAAWSFFSRRNVDVIVSEIVSGPDDRLSSYWSYRDADGTTILELTKHKLRQEPTRFGTGCYAITGWDEEIATVGRTFVRGIDLAGFAAIEFKRSAEGGPPTLIECNYRLVEANEQARAAGVDVARVVYERALGQPVERQGQARDGVRFWHPVRDSRAFLDYRRRGELSLATWLVSLLHRQRTPYFSWHDPLPSVMIAANLVRPRSRLRRAARRLGLGTGGP